MLRKKFIFENEEGDEQELTDYQTLMLLVKGRLNPRSVYFKGSGEKEFLDYVEETYDGLIFTFDGLDEFLKFFFPDVFGDDEGKWYAKMYDHMVNHRYNWRDEISDYNYQEWEQGDWVRQLSDNHIELIKELARFLSPNTYLLIKNKTTKDIFKTYSTQVVDFLETIGLSDDILDVYNDAEVSAVEGEVSKKIIEKYCDTLSEIGIERYSNKYCFWKYEMSWANCLMLYARFGDDENDDFIDLLFEATESAVKKHLPEPHEIRHEFWNQEAFNDTWEEGVTKSLKRKLENIEDDPEYYDEKYQETLDTILKFGGTDKWFLTNDGKYKIRINGIDPTTSKVNFSIVRKNEWAAKTSETDIDSLINIIVNEKLFDILEYKKKLSILRNQTFL